MGERRGRAVPGARRDAVADSGARRGRRGTHRRFSTALRLWGLAFACLIPLVSLSFFALWIGRQHTPQPFRPFEAALLVLEWSIWAALTPVIVGLAWRVPLTGGRWVRGVAVHLVASCVLALVEMTAFVLLAKAMGGYAQVSFADAFWRLLALWYPYATLVYWVIAVAAHGALEFRRARDREVEAARLREHLAAAQLAALRMQLHPHFLCNALNTVAVFLRDGRVEHAEEIVVGLGELLHIALDRMDMDEIPLRDELEFVRRYLEIERIRFSDRMRVSVRAEDDALEGMVPCMMLQPVVENAVRHGISRDPLAGRVAIRASRENGRLDLAVQDDGPGPGGARRSPGHGVGLSNVRSRLQRLYGDDARLDLTRAVGGGALVEISLPYRTRETSTVGAAPLTVGMA